ncbi:phospholipase C [Pararobbsia alpina]|uniref:alkaline phosphatase family protein n=1 Tax=Pararobbsia alpina TaxID=621374 RepID=UPI0039A41E60
MTAIQNIKKLFVLMLENRSYDNIFGWSDISGWTPDGTATQADGLLGKVAISNTDANHNAYAVGPGAMFRMPYDPGHEFTDTLVQLCGPVNAAAYLAGIRQDSAVLAGGTYPPIATSPAALGYAYDLQAHGYDVPVGMRGFTPDQLPVLNFLARQFAVCDRWFASMPGPTWPNRLFALAGTSWGLDHSPSDADTVVDTIFEGAKFGNGSDSLLTRLAPQQWLVAHGDTPQSWSLKGVDAHPSNFIRHPELQTALAAGKVDASFIFIEPEYDPIGGFRRGESMHPCGDVRSGEALVANVYEWIRSSVYWEESLLLIVFDEHGGFFDHVIPDASVVSDMPTLEPTQPTGLTKRGFRFDRFGVRVPAIVVSPYVKQGTIDHGFHDHVSIAATLALILDTKTPPLLNVPRFRSATTLANLLTLSQPRRASEIHPCPAPLPLAPAAAAPKINQGAVAFKTLNWPAPDIYQGS